MDRSQYDLDRYYRLKAEYQKILGGRCTKCGSTKTLEFDHVYPCNKLFNIADMMFRPQKILLSELSKCQLLCKKCHKEKSDLEKSAVHGGGVSGKKNCPCSLCKLKKAEYMRVWKARNK